MKYKELLRKLEKAGFEIEKDGKHSKVLKNGKRVSVVPHHTEVQEATVRQIEKQTGCKLR